jgi:cyclopropane fatty-acyl-phospholipid synthase-like methyltransferase
MGLASEVAMEEQHAMETTEAGVFYDTLRRGTLPSAALAHGEAYIGQECLLTPDEIAAFAQQTGMTAGMSVLDIGSGIGGPACYLAQRFGCQVLGVDVSTIGHEQAVARAHDMGLSQLVQFRCSDIQFLTLPTQAFDVILSLDAWCHIPQRPMLLQRCATWLRPGGRVAFYDHVERQPMPEVDRRRFCTLWRFPDLETPQSYLEALRTAGFRLLWHDETSTYAQRFYSRLLEQYVAHRTEFEAVRGAARYQEGLERLSLSQRFASAGMLGQFACIAEKPVDSA